MLSDTEARPFKQMMAKASKEWRPLKLPQQRPALDELRPSLDRALESLVEILISDAKGGKRATVAPLAPIAPDAAAAGK